MAGGALTHAGCGRGLGRVCKAVASPSGCPGLPGGTPVVMAYVLPGGQVLWAPGCLWHVAMAFHVWPFLRAPAPSPLSAEPLGSLKDLPLSTSIPLATTAFILNPVPPDQNAPGVTLEF